QRGLGLGPLGDVARDLGEPAQRAAALVAQGGDRIARVEAAAVLADAPAFVAVRAALGRLGQVPGRLARGDVLRRVERRAGLADDLRLVVPLDALRAGVPRRDVALRVEAEHRVILHAVR